MGAGSIRVEKGKTAMVPIFISYRREDSAAFSGRLFDRLSEHFGLENVFIDVDTIDMGQDYVKAIEERIAASRIMLVVIGDEWLGTVQRSFRNEVEDFVQVEICTALRLNLKVIPVLISGTRMPGENELPPELAPLARKNAVEVRDSHFHQDVAELISGLTEQGVAEGGLVLNTKRVRRAAGWKLKLGAVAVIILILGISWFQSSRLDPDHLVGTWKADVTNGQGTHYPIIFLFDSFDHQLIGKVHYPTGMGIIVDLRISGQRIQFQTEHVPQFETKPATISFQGRVLRDRIEFLMQHDQGQEQFTAVRSAE